MLVVFEAKIISHIRHKMKSLEPKIKRFTSYSLGNNLEFLWLFSAPVERKTKANVPVGSSDFERQSVREEEVEEDRDDPDVEEIKDRGLQRSNSPELEPAVVPQSPEPSMDCPICQGSFPVTEIEMHAAYCNGEVTVVDERRPDSFRSKTKVQPRLS